MSEHVPHAHARKWSAQKQRKWTPQHDSRGGLVVLGRVLGWGFGDGVGGGFLGWVFGGVTHVRCLCAEHLLSTGCASPSETTELPRLNAKP